MSSSVYVAIPVMAVLAILQTAVWPYFTIFGLAPQLPLLIALSWGLLRGVNEGIIWGFIGGLLLDLFSISPLGLTALSYMIAIAAVLWIQQAISAGRFILPLLLAGLATIIYLIVTLIFLRLLGILSDFDTAVTLLPLILANAIIMLPVYWLMVGLDRATSPHRVEL
ncbi:MAG: rod shape-determining protein MreD [Chloroflexi bacterium]|nr:rod shape-determining protein MreD [Chloroflexota bacterium]